VLQEYTWTQKDLSNTEYAGKYVTHDFISKDAIVRTLESDDNDMELGEHTLRYGGKSMDVDLHVNRDYAQLFYDETFEEELGDEDFHDVLIHFLTPPQWRQHSGLEEQ
jgi:hypothetical protein